MAELSFLGIVLMPLLLLVVGGLVGRWHEQDHLRVLDQREAALANVTTTNLRVPPEGLGAHNATLVAGEVVVATDYFKRFMASMRGIVGGEVRSFGNTLLRGRREAKLLMVEQAAAHGADMVLNVRYVTSTIKGGTSEIICYGTAVRSLP